MAWNEYGYFKPSVPRKADGIKARSTRGAIGTTWWSKRFTTLLGTFGMGSRLSRGRSYARSGQVLSLDVAPGMVSARVQGSRAKPYKVQIGLPTLTGSEWERVQVALADDALHSAKLLAGQMPPEIEELFAGLKLSLFPASAQELAMECTCPDWALPCKHVAAVFYLLAEAFDDDPFRILAWRGQGRVTLLARLRELRGYESEQHESEQHEEAAPGETDDIPAMPLADQIEAFWDLRADLPVPSRGSTPGATGPADLALRRLEDPQVTVRGVPLVEALTPLYQTLVSHIG